LRLIASRTQTKGEMRLFARNTRSEACLGARQRTEGKTMLQQILTKLKSDGSDITLDGLEKLAKTLAELLPQGPVRRGIVSDLGELWACKLFGLTRMPEGQTGYDFIGYGRKAWDTRHALSGKKSFL
jgi:hypothetical protein